MINDVEGRHFRQLPGDGLVPPGFKVRVGKNQVYGYIDATYLSENVTECRYGVLYFVNGMCVYEISRRLPEYVLSSTEAEYVGCSIGCCEGRYIRMVLEAMNEPQIGPMRIGQDNKSCIQIVENPGRHHGRTKHIEVRMRWIEQENMKGRIALEYVNTSDMVADVMTKPLGYGLHAKHSTVIKGVKFPEKRA